MQSRRSAEDRASGCAAQRPGGSPPLDVLRAGQRQRRGDEERRRAGRGAGAGARRSPRCRGCAARPDGDPRADADDVDAQRAPVPRAARRASRRCTAAGLALDTLSMGMSADLEAAIAEGATMVRVGTAIFGARDTGMANVMSDHLHRRRQHGDRAHRRPARRAAPARDFRVVEPLAAQRAASSPTRFPGIGVHRGGRDAGAVAGADIVVLAVKPQQMREAARPLAPHHRRRAAWCCRSPPASASPTCRAGSAATHASCARCPIRRRWSARASAALFARRRPSTPRRALAAAAVLAAGGDVLWVDDESDARRGHRGFRQRTGLRVLLSRGAGAGGAGAGLRRRRCAQARLRDVRRRHRARAASAASPRSCARRSRRRAARPSARSTLLEAARGQGDVRRGGEGGAPRARELGDEFGRGLPDGA